MRKDKSYSNTSAELQSSFRQKKFDPIYLLYGDEDFLIEETTDALISNALDEGTKSFNLDIVYGGEIAAKDIISFAASFPMMAERRVVIVREIERLTTKDGLLPYLEMPNLSTVLVFIASDPDFRQKFYKTAKENVTTVEFKSLYENEIPQWISERVEKLGKRITPEASQLMSGQVRRSLREIQNEIDKLFLFVEDKKVIDDDDVNSIVGISKQFNIFELQKAVGQKNLKRSIEIMERMLEVGESPIGIVVMLTKYFQKLWLVQELKPKMTSEYQLAGTLKISSYFIKEYVQASSRFTSAEIEHSFESLLETDEALKLSADPKLSLTLMLYKCLNAEKVLKAGA